MEDTIAAIATAPGEGGIGIIRISGEKSEEIIDRIFVPASGATGAGADRKMTYGNIVDPKDGSIIDEVLCVLMHGPKTYTTEDVAEIDCHGGMVSLRKTLELVLCSGARMAEPGEFTKRAFLNGRLDLSQAEAVVDVVKAKSDKTFDVAMGQLEGVFSERIREIRKELVDILVNITVNIDYPDEDIEQLTYSKLNDDLTKVRDEISNLLESSDTGRIISEGLKVAIIGKPNVGKSSLMNNLLKENRAIVTDIPGTTRDTIEESLSVRGIPVRLTDTAGIRETEDVIEKIGIERSKESFNTADLVIFIIDTVSGIGEEDLEIISHINSRRVIVVLNKIDLSGGFDPRQIRELLPDAVFIPASMKSMAGVPDIEQQIVDMVYGGKVSQDTNIIVTNVRHKNLLLRAELAANDGLTMTDMGEPLEFIEIDVNECYSSLGEIIGEEVEDDILNEVFSRFCLGK
jgi:tRNA modification GTPase TrmE